MSVSPSFPFSSPYYILFIIVSLLRYFLPFLVARFLISKLHPSSLAQISVLLKQNWADSMSQSRRHRASKSINDLDLLTCGRLKIQLHEYCNLPRKFVGSISRSKAVIRYSSLCDLTCHRGQLRTMCFWGYTNVKFVPK